MTTEDFLNFCNSLSTGYLKPWKAESMLAQYNQSDFVGVELDGWVHNCLSMEGFSDSDCAKAAAFLKKS